MELFINNFKICSTGKKSRVHSVYTDSTLAYHFNANNKNNAKCLHFQHIHAVIDEYPSKRIYKPGFTRNIRIPIVRIINASMDINLLLESLNAISVSILAETPAQTR